MFGHNEIVGKKYFADQPEGTLKVTSRFYTLQGEGPYRGEPAMFLRLSKCNLACSFCDTYFDDGEDLTYEEILTQFDKCIDDFFKGDAPEWATTDNRKDIVLVVTGGEPTLQDNLLGFLDLAYDRGYVKQQIESNGIQHMEFWPWTTLVVSPKCLEKNGQPVKYLKPNKDTLERADCLKFVMSAPTEKYHPYAEVPEWALEWRKETGKPVFVSPMNMYKQEPQKAKEMRAEKNYIEIAERSEVDERISFWEPDLLDMPANQRNHEYTAEYAMRHGLTLNLQTHLYASLP